MDVKKEALKNCKKDIIKIIQFMDTLMKEVDSEVEAEQISALITVKAFVCFIEEEEGLSFSCEALANKIKKQISFANSLN
jgi:redox-regulated HSP33 family molecular chaperone